MTAPLDGIAGRQAPGSVPWPPTSAMRVVVSRQPVRDLLLQGQVPVTRSVTQRRTLYTAVDRALRARAPAPDACPRFFGAAARVTHALGVGWVDWAEPNGLGRPCAALAKRMAAGPDGRAVVAGPALGLLRQLNADLLVFNAAFIQRLYLGAGALFDPLNGCGPALPPTLSPALAFDVRMVVREQLEVENWLRRFGLHIDDATDRALSGFLQALRHLAREAAAWLGPLPATQLRHLVRVDQLLAAAQTQLLPASDVRFSAFEWRLAIGVAHAYALHFPNAMPVNQWRDHYLACLRPTLQAHRLPACRALAEMPAAAGGWR